MRIPSFFWKWRRLLISLLVICFLIGVGFAGWCLWAFHASEDKAGKIPFKNDKSLVLEKKGPGGISYKINNSLATFRLDVARSDKNCERLFPSYTAALNFAKGAGLPSMPSVQLIHGKCKQFDDDLCATLEQAVQVGATQIPSKQAVLQRLVQDLLTARGSAPDQLHPAIERAMLYVQAAVSLGEGRSPFGPRLEAEVDRLKTDFLSHSMLSKPIGIWDENEMLRQIFVQDRYLMQGLQLEKDTEACVVLARVISNDPELSKAFDLLRDFEAKLTNRPVFARQDVPAALPARAVSFRDICSILPQGVPLSDLLAPEMLAETRKKLANAFGSDAGFALCNYAASPEYSLFVEAARNGTLPARNASLELIIDAIKGGKISLKPKEDSGWYDYQWYALETLLIPERAAEAPKLTLTAAYKKRLEEAFKSSVSKNRETHIKQLPVFMMCQKMGPEIPPPKLEIHPEFSAEPTITVYLRTARAYRFLHTALTAVLGDETFRTLRRTSSGNPEELRLGDELNRMALLCYGLHNIVSTELGLVPSYLPDEISAAELDEAKGIASQWVANIANDPDLARDTRIAVPATANPDGTFSYWATGGVRLQRVKYDYKREPSVSGVTPIFTPGYYYLPTDVSVEFQKSGILTRDEFRRMCDSSADEASLRRGLGAPNLTAPWSLPWKLSICGAFLLAGLVVAWRARRAFSRRTVLCILSTLALLLAGWLCLMWLDTGYRMRFLVRHVASRSPVWASLYVSGHIPYGLDEKLPRAELQAMVDLLRDPNPQVRYIALSYLCQLREEKADSLADIAGAEDSLHELAGESDLQLSAPALALLGAFHNDRNVEFLRANLNEKTKDERERVGALIGLTKTGDSRGIDDVLACAQLPEGELRWTAISQLGRYDDKRCIDLIAELLISDRTSSMYALRTLKRFRFYHPEHDLSDRMDPVLLAAVCNPAFSPGHQLNLAEEVRDVPTRILAYENILLSPGAQSTKSVAIASQTRAIWRLREMKSAANSVIPVLEKALKEPSISSDVRKEIEKALPAIRESVPRGLPRASKLN